MKKIFLLIILIYTINLTSAANEIEILKFGISEISPSVFSLNYQIKNSFDTGSYSKLQVVIPFEQYILHGVIENGLLPEKDFLFSQLDIDLNGDKDLDDKFKIKIKNRKITIDSTNISPLTKTTANYQVLSPFNKTADFNLNRITKNGLPFILRDVSSTTPEITLGLNTSGDIEFKKFNNSLLLIEIISSEKNSVDNILINGEKPFSGITNEKELTGGENSNRYAAAKNIDIKQGISSGEIKIEKISRPFSLRLTYYFTISDNLILMNQKVIKVN